MSGETRLESEKVVWVVVAHGSRAAGVGEDHARLCKELDERLEGAVSVSPAFLELISPDVATAIDSSVSRGARTVVLLPYFLHAGNHTRVDLPRLLDEARRRHPAVEFLLAASMGPDPRLVEILAERGVAAAKFEP